MNNNLQKEFKLYLTQKGVEFRKAFYKNTGFEIGFFCNLDKFNCIIELKGSTLYVHELGLEKSLLGIQNSVQAFLDWIAEIKNKFSEISKAEYTCTVLTANETELKKAQILKKIFETSGCVVKDMEYGAYQVEL